MLYSYTLYNIQYMLCCTLIHYTIYNTCCAVQLYTIQYTIHAVLYSYTLYNTCCAVHLYTIQYTIHAVLYTYTLYNIQYMLCCTVYIQKYKNVFIQKHVKLIKSRKKLNLQLFTFSAKQLANFSSISA